LLVAGWTPPEVIGGVTGGIVGIGVVIGAVLILEFGGGAVTLAPIDDPVGLGGTLPDIEDVALHSLLIESYAYPSGHVIIGGTAVVGVVKPSQLLRLQRTYHTSRRRATEQLTFWWTYTIPARAAALPTDVERISRTGWMQGPNAI